MANAVKVLKDLWWVGGGSYHGNNRILTLEGSANVFVFGDGKEYALFDAGIEAAMTPLLENIEKAGVIRPQAVRSVALSHAHADHTGAARVLAEVTGAGLFAHPDTVEWFKADPAFLRVIGLPVNFLHLPVQPLLREGDRFTVGALTLDVLEVPGHIPGGIALSGQINGKKVLFTGDAAIGDQSKRGKGCVGWLDSHWKSNPRRMLASLKKLKALNADIMLPGHGVPINGKAKVSASLVHCMERVKKLLAIPALDSLMPLDLSE